MREKKGVQGFVLSSPIRLDSMDFTIELVFYHILELIETAKDF
jgi:hypothetical protein